MKLFFRKNQADRKYKAYKKFLNSHAPNYASGKIQLNRVKTDKEGNNWYLPKDLLMLTDERQSKIEEYHAAFSYGMSKDSLIEKIEKCLDIVKSQPFEFSSKTNLKKLNNELQLDLSDIVVRLKTIKTEDVMLRVALLYFFIDDEDPYTVNELTQQRKWELAKADDDLRAFFLQTTMILLKEASNKSSEDSHS